MGILSILGIILLLCLLIPVVITLVCGAGFIIAFSDVIVAVIIIGLLIKLFKRKK